MKSLTPIATLAVGIVLVGSYSALGDDPTKGDAAKTEELAFKSHDGHAMLGKLTVPSAKKPRAVVVYVQTAEGMTVDMKRPLGRGTFNYFDLYRAKLPAMDVAFFSYEGRGIKMGDKPPRYEVIDRPVFDTSTLDNKVLDVLSAVATVQKTLGPNPPPVFLIGASEGTLLAAEAAARKPKVVAGLILYGVMSDNMKETFRYINTGGAMLAYQDFFDTDGDGKVSKAEFEADPKTFRKNRLKDAPFDRFDKDGDGQFTVEDMKVLTKPILDAIDKPDFKLLDAWANGPAPAVSLPKDWFRDHFAHKPIWDFLSELDIPVGCFHGDRDASVPVAGVKAIEERAKKAGKSKMEFHYFPKGDHSLGLGAHFAGGPLPDGHKAIFEFIGKVTPNEKTTPGQRKKIMPKELLKSLVGKWEGTCQSWFQPGKLADESKVKGEIHPILGGRFLRHSYEGSIQGKPRHGEETIAFNSMTKRFQISWVDDFHMNYALMFSEGEATERGFVVKGKYDVAPSSPSWGWKTVYELIDDDHLTITAYNITPKGEEAKAVETKYARKK